MTKLTLLLTVLVSTSSFAVTNTLTKKQEKPLFRNYTEKLSFNYGVRYLGPSLSSDYQDGATYNRFKTGQDIFGLDQDSTASNQYYHSLKLGYGIAKDYTLSYTYTFQEDINKDIEFYQNKWDGSKFTSKRERDISDNNKRINLFVSNIYTHKNFSISSNYFYEFASTNSSLNEERLYGLGVEPTISFRHTNPALSIGLQASIQRNYFKNNIEFPDCGGVPCNVPNRYQTLLVSVSPYANYSLNDYTTLKSSLIFDWDQKGDEINDTEVFNKNMDDVAEIALDFNIDYGMYAGTFLQVGIEEASLKKSAIGLDFRISLY